MELGKHRTGSPLSIPRKISSFKATEGSLRVDIRKMGIPGFSHVQRDWPKKAIYKPPHHPAPSCK